MKSRATVLRQIAMMRVSAPALLAAKGVGMVTAAQRPITVGDNPGRINSNAAFAALT